MAEEVLRLPQVITTVGMQRSWIYAAVAEGRFPAPVALGARAIGWRRSEVEAWIAARVPKGA